MTPRRCWALVYLVAALAIASAAAAGEGISELTADNFEAMVGADSQVWVVEFASKMCVHGLWVPLAHPFLATPPTMLPPTPPLCAPNCCTH